MYEEIIIAGSGGQGIMFLGNLICNAAVSQDKYTTFFPAYGAEIRGGTANCSVVISDDEIGSPVISSPSIMIIMNEPSMKKFSSKIKKGGLFFVNSSCLEVVPSGVIAVPATEIASKAGDIRTANMVMLGKFISKTKMFPSNTITAVIKEIFKDRKKLMDINLAAFMRGLEL
ncbi:MAG: 2-oxoacid:acceptor oxidoreductase family protein [Elusimicrobia bacterium]|nr:2-oxoacid:acceptor oxidoreductase family protein [Elusimicrobiota bacterium]